jgi:hypothetical protein
LPGFVLLAALSLALPPGEPDWPAPCFVRGQEIPFAGEIINVSNRPRLSFRNTYELNVRVFVLDTTGGVTDLAVLTAVAPKADQSITAAARTVSGEVAQALKPAARVDFYRIDPKASVRRLTRPGSAPPYRFAADHATDAVTAPSLDGPTYSECGFLPPIKRDAGDAGLRWTREADELWNGSRVIDLVGMQASKDYDNLAAAVAGWRRVDRFYLSPLDGLPRAYARRIEQREGKSIIATLELRLEMKPPLPPVSDAEYRRLRQDAEMAAWFAGEWDRLHEPGIRPDAKAVSQLQARIARYLVEHPPGTSFRPAIEVLVKRDGE